jgi:hypothetical protein
MVQNKVVVKFKDDSMLKGKTSDFFPNKTQFHLEQLNGEIMEISIEDLKAVFFVKDFDGNKTHQDNYTDKIVRQCSDLPWAILRTVKVFM